MKYRDELQGLRAIAVMPVIFFHAGFDLFRGGFLGVDIFFVISGYLITNIIILGLEGKNFSIANFYEARARRILPALFFVMFISLIAGYLMLMPDEFKNFGQSLVSTSLFLNNILLALTGSYWELASEFKPLLHTWSLGVEGQYYLIAPVLLVLLWLYFRSAISPFFMLITLCSFLLAICLSSDFPRLSFYILPTRIWELSAGGLAALYLRNNARLNFNFLVLNLFSLLGLILILISIFFIYDDFFSPIYTLIPVVGTVLVIACAVDGTFVKSLLSQSPLVYLGSLSFSLYLWHQPVFAYLRAYLIDRPTPSIFLMALLPIFIFSCLSWKYIERPFRNIKIVGSKLFLSISIFFCIFFIAIGIFLNESYGIPSRVFDSSIEKTDLDKRIYNERAFFYKSNAFDNDSKQKLLIVGNSFARDFLNITLETYNTKNVQIIYRDDLTQCIFPFKNSISEALYSKANVIVFGSGGGDRRCLDNDIDFVKNNNKKIFYVGTKDFGYNLNWLGRLSENERVNRFNHISEKFLKADIETADIIPENYYISLLRPTVKSHMVPITDEFGRMLSTDRTHLTKYGAIYFGNKAVKDTAYSKIFSD